MVPTPLQSSSTAVVGHRELSRASAMAIVSSRRPGVVSVIDVPPVGARTAAAGPERSPALRPVARADGLRVTAPRPGDEVPVRHGYAGGFGEFVSTLRTGCRSFGTASVRLSGCHHGRGRPLPGHSRAVPAQLEENGPAALVAVVPPPVRDQVHELKAQAVLTGPTDARDRGTGRDTP